MYGLVNRAIRDHVISSAGQPSWDAVKEAAGLDDDWFIAMDPYDDAITYALVAAAGQVLGVAPNEVLEGFGRYWILYTGAEGWGPILDMQGSSVAEVLGNLDDMHARLQVTMPSMVMPRFSVVHASGERIEFTYHSPRDGLAAMVVGIVKGLAERCGEHWEVAQTGQRAEAGFDTFMLTNAALPNAGLTNAALPNAGLTNAALTNADLTTEKS